MLSALGVLVLAAAACGKSSDSGSSVKIPTQKVDAKLRAMVPAALRQKGVVKVATDPSYAPMEFYAKDNKTIVGADADLGAALGQVLGVRFQFVQAGFDSIIPGLAAGKYDISMSSFSDTKEREQTVDFVTYGQAGTSLMVKKGNPLKLSPDDNSLCGKSVAVEKGTTQSDSDIPARSQKCQAAGKPAVKAVVFPDQSAANLALSSGRADGVLADQPVIVYAAAQSNDKFEVAGKAYAVDQYAVAVRKGSGQFTQALLGAMQKLIDSGTYDKILKKWDVSSIAISKPAINVAQG